MNYAKPQVDTLGDAAAIIESINPLKPPRTPFDFGQKVSQPAYDLDE
jgi:hypothetical protein